MKTAEEFFRNKIKEQSPNIEIVNLSQELITAEQGMLWAHEFKQLHLHNVSVRDFVVGDVICTQDGKIWVINEINGNDLLVDGNGKRNYPLEKCDVSHAY